MVVMLWGEFIVEIEHDTYFILFSKKNKRCAMFFLFNDQDTSYYFDVGRQISLKSCHVSIFRRKKIELVSASTLH